jgi:Na+/H+ antiporter NhaC
MESLRMNYRFTALLIVMITLLALLGGPAHSRNEYLNEYGARCGDFETRITQNVNEDQQLHWIVILIMVVVIYLLLTENI